ncbi:MAG: amidohydrolase family protein [Bryobacteraceae bacterium]|nr:amidohydrolase family protein [Bryobacteraceae bacterium]
MQTPWGDLTVCDAHVHFFSPRFFATLANQRQPAATAASLGPLLGWEIPETPEALAGRWVEEFERAGVAMAAIIASVPGDEESVAAARAVAPQRFAGYFMVNPLAADATSRVERALAEGLRGVCFFPAMHGYSIQAAEVDAILASVPPGTVIFVHCGVLSVGVRKKLGLKSPFDLSHSNPVDLHAVALRYPDLRFVIPHFGAGYLREALMVCDLCPNVLLDTSSSNQWMRFHPGLTLDAVFRAALDVAGPRRLLFGTDSSFFPRGWNRAVFEQQVTALERAGAGADEARFILGANLLDLLG